MVLHHLQIGLRLYVILKESSNKHHKNYKVLEDYYLVFELNTLNTLIQVGLHLSPTWEVENIFGSLIQLMVGWTMGGRVRHTSSAMKVSIQILF